MRNHCEVPRPRTHGGRDCSWGSSPKPSFPLYHFREIVEEDGMGVR